MDYSVGWSSRAIADVNAIAEYIARDSPTYASTIVGKILGATRNLGQFPLSGRMVPEFSDQMIREKIVAGYRVIYRVKGETVTIATVMHGRQVL
ncbi:MAG: type II toxin-antitoxin system RelE/ParE family toxin [Cyanobacteria bacterium]|nr:type II toxin-antitoxin system RelE/ParE family toxin [Cyanobacteriota bacterium]